MLHCIVIILIWETGLLRPVFSHFACPKCKYCYIKRTVFNAVFIAGHCSVNLCVWLNARPFKGFALRFSCIF